MFFSTKGGSIFWRLIKMSKEVLVSIDDLLDLNLEQFLEVIEDRYFQDLDEDTRLGYILYDITYKPIRVAEDGSIVLLVSGTERSIDAIYS